MLMDLKLKESALAGDVGFLREALASRPTNYFPSRCSTTSKIGYYDAGNIFHQKTPLDETSEVGAAWLVESLLKDPSAIDSSPFAWVEPCKRGDMLTVRAFIDHCPNFMKLCLQQKDTPLHQFRFKYESEYKEFSQFLKLPLVAEMVNALDSENATPLHRAIERKDLSMVEALLSTRGIDPHIKDKRGKTPVNLLAELCDQDDEWAEMFEPWLFIQPTPNLLNCWNCLG